MVKRAIGSSVLLGVAVLSGCGGDSASSSTSVPPPPAFRSVERSSGPIEIVRVEPDCRALAGAEEPIRVEVTVATDGSVSEARLLSSAPEDVKGLVLRSVRTWRYQPASQDGRTAPATFPVTLRRCP
jgi:TonB family protein